MQEFGPCLQGQLVLDKGEYLLIAPRDSLYDSIGRVSTQSRFEDDQLAHSSDVMSGDNARYLRRMSRHGASEENPVGPVTPAAVIFSLCCPVGIHREQKSRPNVRNVGVFPSQVENTPVLHDSRAEVVVLLETDLTDISAR